MPYSIMIDAGHGGNDPGAVYKGRKMCIRDRRKLNFQAFCELCSQKNTSRNVTRNSNNSNAFSLHFKPESCIFFLIHKKRSEYSLDSSVPIQAVTILILVLLSAFFSSAETSMTAANRIRIHSLAEQGNKRAIIRCV